MTELNSVGGRAFVVLLIVFGMMSMSVAAVSSATVSSGVVFESNSGLAVENGKSISQDLTTTFPDSNTVELQNTTFSSSAAGSLTADQYTGDFTNISDVTVGSQAISITPPDKPQASVNGSITDFRFSDAAIGDGDVDFVYAAGGSGNITITNLQANTGVKAFATDGIFLDGGITDSNGDVTFELSNSALQGVKLETTSGPEIQENTASPTGQVQFQQTVDLSVNVSDADFSNDTLTAEFFVEGTSVGADTITSGGEVSTSTTVRSGGVYEWYVEVEDAYNNSDRSDADDIQSDTQNFTFDLPAKLIVRNASKPSQLVNGGSVEVTFFGDDRVVTRSDTDQDGNISFDGLPLDQRFEAELTADGYNSRTIVISSLFEQNEAFMLPSNVTTVRPRFTLDSAVSSFDERESELIIERPLNRSGGLEYEQINEQQFGVSGVDIKLAKNQRYRLRVRSPNGEVRQIGSYRATATEQVTLQIESGNFDASQSVQGVEFASVFDSSGPAVQATVRGSNVKDSSITVTRKNDSTVIFSDSGAGNLSVSVPAKNNTQYRVNMTAVLKSGETVSTTQQVSSGSIPAATVLDQKWQNLLAMAVLVVIAGLFTRANAGIGAISTASVGGILWFMGWLNGVATGLAVVVAMLIGLVAYAKQQRAGVPT